MADAADFLKAVLAAPDDDRPRLAYADWLDEQGDAYGEFVRVQVELAGIPVGRDYPLHGAPCRPSCVACRLEYLRRRERKLLGDNHYRWLDTLSSSLNGAAIGCANLGDAGNVEVTYRRGFIDQLNISDRDLFAHGAAVLARCPVRTVRLTTMPVLTATDDPQNRRAVFHLQDGTATESHGYARRLYEAISGQTQWNRDLAHRLLAKQFPGVRILLPDDPAE